MNTPLKSIMAIVLCSPVFGFWSSSARAGQPELNKEGLEKLMFMDIPATVYSTSKKEEKISEASGLVTVLSGEEIKKLGFRTIPEAVASVVGFHEMNIDSKRSVSMSGAGEILFLVDGIPLRTFLHEYRGFLSEAYSLEYVKRIEIIRGPNSVIWGNNAIFGTVNIITKSGSDLNGLRTSASYGSGNGDKNRRQGAVEYGKEFPNGNSVYFSGSYLKREGGILNVKDSLYDRFYTAWQWGNKGTTENQEDHFAEFFAKVKVKDFTFETRMAEERDYYPIAEYNALLLRTDNAWRSDPKSFISVKYDKALSPDTSVNSLLYYQKHHYRQRYAIYPKSAFFPNDYSMYNDISMDVGGLDTRVHTRLFSGNQLMAGAYYEHNYIRRGEEYYTNPVGPGLESGPYDPMGGPISAHVLSGYLQDTQELTPRMKLSGALRYDRYSPVETDLPADDPDYKKAPSRTELTPKLSLVTQVGDKTWVKTIYSKGIRSPFYDVLISRGYTTGKPLLDNEKADSYSAQMEHQLSKTLAAKVDYTYYDIGVADAVDLPSGQQESVIKNKKIRSFGTALRGNISDGIYAYANYNRVSVTDADSLSNNLRGSYPKNMFNIGAVVKVRDNYSATLRGKYVDKVTATGLSYPGLNGETTGTTPSYFLADAGLSAEKLFALPLEFSFFVYNVFNKEYGQPFYELVRPMPGRSFIAKAAYKF